VDGVVVYPVIALGRAVRKVQPGDALQRGQVFVRLPDSSKLVVRLQIEEGEITKAVVGASVAFTPRAYPDLTLHGRIATVSNLAVEDVRQPLRKYFEVVAEIDPEGGAEALLPGMVADAVIAVKDHGIVRAVPREFAREENGRWHLVCEDRAARFRRMDPGSAPTDTGDFLLWPVSSAEDRATWRVVLGGGG
jgi:multidrug efflux pump subunit AcrA (membrane-fusion protein)